MALYRRYRPQRFQDVIGQDHVIRPIMAALRAEKTAHAYLFSGPRGCGKTTSARILARCLNCVQAPTDTPCGECESCRELSAQGSGSLDVIELDAASHGGVEDARELVERAAFAPARDRYKIFIIDEAHMVTNQGFNALLKLVEEPPEHVKFIFATTEPDKVISTIRSRTHHYPFRLVPPEILQEYLAQTASQEGIDLGPGVLPLVVRAGGGSVRDSLSVLDQLLGGATGGRVELSEAAALLGYTDVALIDEAAEALGARDGARLFGVAENVIRQGLDPRRFVEDLLQRLRDVIVVCLAGEGARPVLASMPADQVERLFAQAEVLGPVRASRLGDLALEGLNQMVGATSPRLQLELLCARMLTVEEGSAAGVPVDVSAGDPVRAVKAPGAGGPSGAMPEELRARMRASMGLDTSGRGPERVAAVQMPVSEPKRVTEQAPVSERMPVQEPVAVSEPVEQQRADQHEVASQVHAAQPEAQREQRPAVKPVEAAVHEPTVAGGPELTVAGRPGPTMVGEPEPTVAGESQHRQVAQPVERPEKQGEPEAVQQAQPVEPEGAQPEPAVPKRAAEQPEPTPAPGPTSAQQQAPASLAAQAVSQWGELLERADADPHMRVAFSMLKHCRVDVEGEALALVFEPNMAGLMQRFMSKGFAEAVARFISAHLGGEVQVLAHVEGSSAPKADAAQGAASARPAAAHSGASVSGEGAGEVPSLDRLLDNLEAQVPPEEYSPSADMSDVSAETSASAQPANEGVPTNVGDGHGRESSAPASSSGDAAPESTGHARELGELNHPHAEVDPHAGTQPAPPHSASTPNVTEPVGPVPESLPGENTEPSFIFDELPEIPPFPGESGSASPSVTFSAMPQASAPAPSAQADPRVGPGNAGGSAPSGYAEQAQPDQPTQHLQQAQPVGQIQPVDQGQPAGTPWPAGDSQPAGTPWPAGAPQPAEHAHQHQVGAPQPAVPHTQTSPAQTSTSPTAVPHTPVQQTQTSTSHPRALASQAPGSQTPAGDIFAEEGVDLSDPSIDDSHEVGLNVVLETFGGVVIEEQVQQPQGAGQ